MEQKRVKKYFFSSSKEQDWLNAYGQKGYRLVSKKDSRYTFEVEEGKIWYYRVEWLDCSPKSEQIQEYLRSYEDEGVFLTAAFSLWGYFCSEAPICAKEQGIVRTAKHYRNVAFLLYALDVVTTVLIGYQIAIRSFLETQELFIKAPALDKTGNVFMKLLHRIPYGAQLLFYRYTQLWARLFGNTRATAVLSVLIPLAVVLAVVGALWHTEWLKHRIVKTKPTIEQMEEQQDDSEVSEKSEGNC